MTDIDDSADVPRVTRRRPWLARVGVLASVVIIGGLLAWAVQQASDADKATAAIDRQRDAVLTATGFVEALMSYDFTDLTTQQAAVERFATDTFLDEYTDAFADEVRQQIIDEQAASSVTVQDVYVSIDDGDELTAIVVARSEVSSARGGSAQLESFLRIRLVRLGGRWRVDDLTSLGSRDRSVPLVGSDVESPVSEESDDGG